jgi:hypothetical protein
MKRTTSKRSSNKQLRQKAADTEIEDAVNQLKKEVMSEEQDVAKTSK